MRTFAGGLLFVSLMAGIVVAGPPATASAPVRQWAVSICDSYLRGIGAEDTWSAAKAVGLSRVEVGVDANLACPNLFEKTGAPYRIDTPEARAALREKLSKAGMTIGCFVMITRLDLPGKDDETLARIERIAEAAPEFRCRTIMLPIMVAAAKDIPLTDEAFVERCKPFVRSLDAIAAKTGVQIAIENLGLFWNRREIMEPVLRVSRPDRVGMLLDATNLYWYGYPLNQIYELARTFAPYVRYVHIKNVRYPADQRNRQRTPGWEYGKYAEPVRTGDIDFVRIVGTLAKAGYVGDLTIEDDSLPHFDAEGKTKTIADDVVYLQDLAKRFPRRVGDVGDVKSYRLDGNVLSLECTGGWVRLTACAGAVIRVQAGPSQEARQESRAVDACELQETSVRVDEADGRILLLTDGLETRIDRHPFRITFFHPETYEAKLRTAAGPLFEWTPGGVRTRLLLREREREHLYGLSLGFHGFERRGGAYEIKTNADPKTDNGNSHIVAPLLVSTRDWGVFLNNTGYSLFRVDDAGDEELTILSPGAVADWYFIHSSFRKVVATYASLIGRIDMPARWGLGPWFRTNARATQDQVKDVAEEFRKRRIPCDVIGLEPGWQTHAYSCSYDWNKAHFPDPAGLIAWLRDRHFRLNLWTHAYVHPSSPLYKPLRDQHCAADKEVWKGLVPDFTLPRTAKVFDEGFIRPQIAMGVSGYKLDECDGSDYTGGWFFPDDTRFPGGLNGAEMHNIFGASYQNAFHEVFRRHNLRTYFQCRATSPTGMRRPTAIYSDLYELRDYLRAQVNAGAIEALWCPEVRDTKTPEEFVRRSQLMFFGVLAQLDGWNSGIFPWGKGEEAEAIFRRYAELRMRLVPYLYSAFWEMHTDGLPVIRPLVMDYRDDDATYHLDDQFLFGDSIMVAPVVTGTQREICFPAGRWTHLLTGQTVSGPGRVSVDVPLEQVPLYVRDGTVLPLGPVRQYDGEPAKEPLGIEVFGGQSGGFVLFEDDGVTYDYERGRCATTPLEYREYLDRCEMRIGPTKGSYTGQPAERDYSLVLRHIPVAKSVQLNGKDLPRRDHDAQSPSGAGWVRGKDGTVRIWLPRVAAGSSATVSVRTDRIEADADGFAPLFNNRDLSGWQIMGRGGEWVVANGELVCKGRSGEFPDWVRSAQQFKDFTLRLEYNMSESCNSGVFVRTTETGRQSRTGMEIQIHDDFGQPVDPYVNGAIYDAVVPRSNPVHKAGEWNQLEITCRGQQMKVTLNGVVIHDLALDDPAVSANVPEGRKLWQRAKRGYVGLQNHGGRVRFRNIRIKEYR